MTMKKSATPTVQASGVFHRMPGVWRPAGSFLPVRRLTFVVLLLAAATFGGVFAVAQAQEVEGAISGLTLSSDTPGTLTVSWDTPSPAPSDYRLRWAPAESDYPSWKDDNETDRGNAYPGGGDTSLTLSGLSEGTEYKVQVRARYNDGAHKDSPWSGPWTEEMRGQPSEESAGSGVKGATDDPSAPAAPNLSGTAVTPEGHVLLAWLDPSDDSITGYQVLRGPDADNLVVIEEDTGSNGTSYTDTSPPAGRTHTYAVKARNAAGLSPPSDTVTANVPEAEEEEEEELVTSQQTSDATLVSNLGQTSTLGSASTDSTIALSQAFVAGPGLAGFDYRFQGVRLAAFNLGDTPVVRAGLHRDNGGRPGTRLYALDVPSDFGTNFNTATEYILSAPAGAVLDGGARYWLVLNAESGEAYVSTTALTAEDQDPPPAEGWSIDDTRYTRPNSGGWVLWTDIKRVIKLAVLGSPEWDTSEPASEPADGDLPADTTTRGLLVVDGAGVTGTHFSYDDVDWYVVELEADTDYEFRGVNTTPHSRLHVLKVHNHEGEEQSSSLIEINTSRGQYDHVERLNKLPYKTSTAGTYYVSIEPWNYGSGAEKVYTLTARSDDSPDCRTGERPASESFRLCATGTDPVDHPGVTLDPARVLPIAIRVGDKAGSYIMRTRPDSTSSFTDDVDMFRVLLTRNILYRFEWDVACVHEGIILGIIDGNQNPQVSETSVSRIHTTCTNVTVEFTPNITNFFYVIVSARGSQFPVSVRDRSPRVRYPFLGVHGTLTVVDTTAPPPNSPAKGDPLSRGERKVGATLAADIGGITDADSLTDPMFTYQWQRDDGGTPADISGATSDTYTLTDDDVGKRIRLQVQFTDDGGFSETRTGPATSVIARAPRTLVTNYSRSISADTTLNVSSGFGTGAHPLGYSIERVTVHRSSFTSAPAASAEFGLYTSTVTSNPIAAKPDDLIIRVSGPDRVSGLDLTFDLPSRVKLSRETIYHIVLTSSSGAKVGCRLGNSGTDSGSLTGFSMIGRTHHFPSGGAHDGACLMRIEGFELVSSKFVEKVEFTSSPAQAGMYATGEVIEATATLSEAVTIDGPAPALALQIGDNEREMEYAAPASSATEWVFRYTVTAGDRDDDGVSIEHNELQGYADADLSHRGIDNDRERHVNAAPRIVSRQVSSRPVAPNWYGPGEQIQFTVGFSLPVTVVGDPELEFDVTTPGPQNELASYLSGSGTTELVFSYTVGTDDDDPDGIWSGADSLRLDGDDSITGVYNGLDAVLDHSALGTRSSHRIDQNPRVVSQKVTSDPAHGANSDTYGAGDTITFEVVFNQTVTVTGGPRLRFNVSGPGGAEYADYTGGTGTNTLEFSYTVLATETDTDGIYLFGDPLTLETGESILGADNSLPAVNEISGANRPVGGHKIDGAITN